MRVSLQALSFAFGLVSTIRQATATAQCSTEADLVNDAVTDVFEAEPITVVSQTGSTVTFTVSNTWSDDMLCLIATHYTNTENVPKCPGTANAAPGEFAEYTAKCVGGFALVDLYVYDPTFLDNLAPTPIAALCEQTTPAKTYKYQYSIPCGGPTCPPVEEPTCAYAPGMSYDFASGAGVADWLFGKVGGTTDKYLVLDATTTEVSKTFDIPTTGTTGLTFEFEFLTIAPLAADQKVFARVGDYYLNMTSALKLGFGDGKTEYYGEIKAYVQRLGFTPTIKATITIPSSLYSAGYISLGVRTTGSSATAIAGVDNIKVILGCDLTRSPTIAPPVTTVPPPVTTTTPATTTTTIPKQGGGGGDPHFSRWDHSHESFHGECDLLLVRSKEFHNGAGLDLHVRTTIQDYFSYMETAALKIGSYVVEFHSTYFLVNGEKRDPKTDLPFAWTEKDGFQYTITDVPAQAGQNVMYYQYYQVNLHEDSNILFKFYKKFLTVSVNGHASDFMDSVGMLGEYSTGAMLGRDGQMMTDFDQYGFEWQIVPQIDGQLFEKVRAPQLPYEQCRMPTASRPARRKLRGDRVLVDAAMAACAHISGSDNELCVDDVLATGDIGLATNW